MSVRRLADDQPASFAFTLEAEAFAKGEIAKYPQGRQASAVLALLWRAQKQNDYWLPKPAIELVARMLEMPYIRVLEIATFYTMFNLAPVGQHFIQMCGTTPCVLAGSNEIRDVLQARVGPAGKVSADGMFCWMEVECLGACCNAPMVQINDEYYEDLTPKNFNTLLDDLAAGRPVKVGSQIGRHTSEPVGGLTALRSLYGVDGRQSAPDAQAAPSTPDHAAAAHEKAASNAIGKSEKLPDTMVATAEQNVARPESEPKKDYVGIDISDLASKKDAAVAAATARGAGLASPGAPSDHPVNTDH